MESYPFKKRLSEIMSSPAVTCTPDTTVKWRSARLTEHGISFLVVSILRTNPSASLRAVTSLQKSLHLIMSIPFIDRPECHVFGPPTMTPDTYMYEAMAFMTRHRLNYLPIVDRNQFVGVVTPRDLMRYRSQKALMLLGNIREEKSSRGWHRFARRWSGLPVRCSRKPAALRKSWRSCPISITQLSVVTTRYVLTKWLPQA